MKHTQKFTLESGVRKKLCNSCRQYLPVGDFYFCKSRGRNGSYDPYCRPCKSRIAKQKIEQLSPAAKSQRREYFLKYMREYKEKNSEKLKQYRAKRHPSTITFLPGPFRIKKQARNHLQDLVRRGKLVKPSACESCGENKRLEGHHYAGYDISHWADVEWLCRKCHMLKHDQVVQA